MKVVPTSFWSETHPLLGRKDLGVELDKRVGAVGASKGGKLIDVQVTCLSRETMAFSYNFCNSLRKVLLFTSLEAAWSCRSVGPRKKRLTLVVIFKCHSN